MKQAVGQIFKLGHSENGNFVETNVFIVLDKCEQYRFAIYFLALRKLQVNPNIIVM